MVMYRPSFGRKRTIELALYGENDFVITYNGSLVQATNIIKMMMIDEPEVLDPAIAKLPLHFTENIRLLKVRLLL